MTSLSVSSVGEYVSNQSVGMGQRVMQAIQKASSAAGVDFSYLVQKASQESSFDPSAKAKSSSATGLYQFVEQTWLRVVKNYGQKYGLGSYANEISVGNDGVARVSNTQDKQAILALRTNPEISACMAAELTNENKEVLQSEVGGKVGSTELYLAHFLGANGACSFLSTMRSNPNASAASVLPEAAAANPSVFYDKASGQAKTVSQVYSSFAQKFDKTGATTAVAGTSSVGDSYVSSPVSVQTASIDSFSGISSSLGACSSSSPFASLGLFGGGTNDSAPFAAMMIAQMDLGSFSIDADRAASGVDEDQRRKENVMNYIGLSA